MRYKHNHLSNGVCTCRFRERNQHFNFTICLFLVSPLYTRTLTAFPKKSTFNISVRICALLQCYTASIFIQYTIVLIMSLASRHVTERVGSRLYAHAHRAFTFSTTANNCATREAPVSRRVLCVRFLEFESGRSFATSAFLCLVPECVCEEKRTLISAYLYATFTTRTRVARLSSVHTSLSSTRRSTNVSVCR